jgi:hypothetical protein
VALGFVVSAFCLVAALLVDGPAWGLLLIQAVAAPALSLVDHLRYVAFGLGRPDAALLLDTLWFAVTTAGMVLLRSDDSLSLSGGYAMWVLPTIPLAIAGYAVARIRPRPRQTRAWLRGQRALIPGFTAEAALLSVGSWLTFGAVAFSTGIAGLGVLRMALIPATGIIVLFMGVSTALLRGLSGHALSLRQPALAALLSTLMCALVALAMIVTPQWVWASAFGDSWRLVRPVALVLVGFAAAQVVAQMGMVALKASGRAWFAPRVRLSALSGEAALAFVAGAIGGVLLAATGIAVAWVVTAVVVWVMLVSRVRAARP